MINLNFLKELIESATEPYKEALTISAGTLEYSFFKQFYNHFNGRLLKYHQRPDCEESTKIEGLRIFNDSLDILDKLKKHNELREIINNLENGSDLDIDTLIDYTDIIEGVKTNSSSFTTGTLTDKGKTTIVNSDNNSYTDKQIPEGEEQPEENLRDIIDYSLPLNQYQKNLVDDENKTETLGAIGVKRDLDNKRINLKKNKKEMTNIAKDAYDYANKELPLLRLKLLNRFKPLFLGNPC